ncbi:MAG: host specificity protein [Planctomycetia bacterium]|nr:host specificity protein [Planctomycetia bacterium]
MPRFFKNLLATDKLIRVFCAGRLVHPVSLQLFGLAGGYDGFWLDAEHAGISTEQITMAALVGRACGLGSFVRMPVTNYAAVTQCLESGADGVMAAQVVSAAEAEKFVTWAKFAPRGMRGVNTQGADAHFTHKTAIELARDANRDHFVAIQIETLGALNQVDEIAAIDDVDLLFVGPADLSSALGVLGQANHETVWAAIDRVAEACRRRGKAWGIVPADPAYADRCAEKGCRMITFGSDVSAMRLGVQALKTMFASQFKAS